MTKGRPQVGGVRRVKGGYAVRIMVAGVRRQATFASREEAEDARDQIKTRAAAARLGIVPRSLSAAVATFSAVLDAYSRECEILGRSAAHLRAVGQAAGLIYRWRGRHADASKLTRADLVDFVGWSRLHTRSRGRAIHNALVILGTALRRADLPVPAAPRIELPARAPKTYSRDELARLLLRLPLGTVARTAVEIGLRTGAREAEVRRIRVGDLDLARGTLVLRHAKGRPGRRGSEDVLPVSPGLARALRALLAQLPADLAADQPLLAVGQGASRRPLGQTSLRRVLESACRAAGVPVRTTVGWTRAQAATLARDAGMPLGVVAGALGHADERTTRQHYDESSRETVERWAARQAAGAVIDRVLPLATGGKGRTIRPRMDDGGTAK